MRITADELYDLLPAVYRIRDVEQGSPLRALVEVIAEQAVAIEDDIANLYSNWFIETCAEWVVPYIGDLLGVRGTYGVSDTTLNQRAFVANTLAYRRRKGTASVLEGLARDVTGWPARAVEFFQLLATTQHLNHLRPANHRTPDLRRSDRLALLDGPFDEIAHTVDVRHIANRRGRHNLPNAGIFLWRLQSYPLERVTAHPVADPPDGRYTFDPTGLDLPLFNRPRTETEIEHIAEERDVPAQLRRRPLFDELEGYRRSLVAGNAGTLEYFGSEPVIRLFVDDGENLSPDVIPEVPAARVLICDLSDWTIPSDAKEYLSPRGGAAQSLPITAAVDPVLGRITIPTEIVPAGIEVSYSYGFSGDLGGGPYDRSESIAKALSETPTWSFEVNRNASSSATTGPTLTEAVEAWNLLDPGSIGIISITDSRSYVESLTGATAITIPEGSQLAIVAAEEARPHLRGNIEVSGSAAAESRAPGRIAVDGLLIEGTITVLEGHLGTLRLAHSTLPPGIGSLTARSGSGSGNDNNDLKIELERSICGPITADEPVPSLRIAESIVGSNQDSDATINAIDVPGSAATITSSTIFGICTTRTLEAENSIFTGTVSVERRQSGCVRFSLLPPGSRAPRRHRCQPELALSDRATALGLETLDLLPSAERQTIVSRLRPTFTSLHYGNPGFGQLASRTATEIRTGADDGAEMGAFQFLRTPQRESNLRGALQEYLRFGFEAGIFYVT